MISKGKLYSFTVAPVKIIEFVIIVCFHFNKRSRSIPGHLQQQHVPCSEAEHWITGSLDRVYRSSEEEFN
jgi:hypothetical protein